VVDASASESQGSVNFVGSCGSWQDADVFESNLLLLHPAKNRKDHIEVLSVY
jgi:hypothetical protein